MSSYEIMITEVSIHAQAVVQASEELSKAEQIMLHEGLQAAITAILKSRGAK